eukprot:TRINITY_DN7519_c0_g1_i1.p1 TRINITY_DN7519_c0_g1~~TRINITY_DN7519_c0_g1_i1.p1  ORF type:complete len:355 (-),score=35.95 TRINITY_DN7519_c0_g1_i1:95-1159(-)
MSLAVRSVPIWGCVAAYLVSSISVTSFNAYMLDESRFPYPVALVLFHELFGFGFISLLFFVRPTLFTSLTSKDNTTDVDCRLMFGSFLPIAILFGAQIALTNIQSFHASLSVMQVMKTSNLIIVYIISVRNSLNDFDWKDVRRLMLIMSASALIFWGEMTFSMQGLLVLCLGHLFDSTRIVIQAKLLNIKGICLDPLTFSLLVLPLLSAAIGLVIFTFGPSGAPLTIPLPHWSNFVSWWPLLFANSFLVLVLNLVVSVLIQRTSAVSFVLAGIVRDICVTMGGAAVFGEAIHSVQVFGFALHIFAVWTWSCQESRPEEFVDGEGAVVWGCFPQRFGSFTPLLHGPKAVPAILKP